MKIYRRLPVLLIATTAAASLLWGCNNEPGDEMSEGMGEVGEETREMTGSAMRETEEAIEETGDRIESATD
jgi:hypothetical protein